MVILNEHDCIVVGAGIVGTSFAYALAKEGRKVVLIERDLSEPDRIVGELLQPGGIKALEKLGMLDTVKGIDAITNYGYGVFYGNKTVHLKYPNASNSEESEWGCSFHHGKFIMKLREACKSQKLITVVEATVNELITDEGDDDTVKGVLCTVKRNHGISEEGEPIIETKKIEYFAPLTIVADGCFSKFRKEVECHNVLVRSHFVGAILKDCPLPLPNHGHVVLAQPSPILLYQIGTHDTRILVDVPGKVPSAGTGALKKYMLETVLPQLPVRVQESFKEAMETQRLRVMPNSFLPSVRNKRKGLILMGDALNMRHPLTGGGMTVAFNDVLMLSNLLKREFVPDFSRHDLILEQLDTFASRRKEHCTVINVLAQALYELFSAGDDWRMGVLREACFAYFELGGICADHPMGLLSGLRKSPLNLYLHFFAVAFYGMSRLMSRPALPVDVLMLPRESTGSSVCNAVVSILATVLSLPINLLYGIIVIYSASIVILPLIWTEMRV